MYCDGIESCNSARIMSIQSVLAWGYNSLMNATIMSNYNYEYWTNISIESNELNITIHDDIEIPYFVYCNETDICYINCLSNHACTYMNLQCDGVCYIHHSTS